MGKQRRHRQKLHLSSKNTKDETVKSDEIIQNTMDVSPSQPILMQPSENLFAGININFDELKKDLDDIRSVKSFKSLKSEHGGKNKTMLKKDKIKLRRDVLLKKLDVIKQAKLESKGQVKRKNISIISDTNPLHDALPTLELLLKDKSIGDRRNKMDDDNKKWKGIEKAKKRNKQLVQGVQMMKCVLKNKQFQKDPLKMISEQIKVIVDCNKLQNK